MDDLQPKTCAICGKEGSKHCARCQSIDYCSTQCQKSDYPTHKLLCRTFMEFDASARPSPQHFRAILFPEDEQKPKIIWLHCPWIEGDEGRFELPDVEPFLGDDSISRTRINFNRRLKCYLPDYTNIRYRDAFLEGGSKLNQCIRAITNTSTTPYWCGPIVALGCKGFEYYSSTEKMRDVNLSDFRHLVDYFDLWDKGGSEHQQSTKDKDMVSGVRINCLGDFQVCKRPKFEPVEVSLSDTVFCGNTGIDRWTSDIADRIGLPVFTRKYSPDARWAEQKSALDGSSYENNQEATFLHLNCKDRPGDFMGWGWVPMDWQSGSGSVLVVRQDKKPLHPWHLEALSEYCVDQVQPIFEAALEKCPPKDPNDPRTIAIRNAALAKISRSNFLETWWRVSDRNQVPNPFSI
ncbi:hypothetical protein IWZ00DRAFT_70361 [Phyllosticta capitalensis]